MNQQVGAENPPPVDQDARVSRDGRRGNRGFRGGRGRGRGNLHHKASHRGSQQQQQLPTPIIPGVVTTKPNVTSANLEPLKAATQSSELKNDPMWQDFEAEGLEGFVAYAPRRTFAVTLEGLSPLIDQVYDTLNSASRSFSKNVPRSAFSYYCWMLAYARVVAIKQHRGQETYAEKQFLEYMRGDVFPVPTPIEEYLRSIGNIKDTTGIEYRIEFPAWPDNQGTYGQMNEVNHVLYESMAAPRVLAERIHNDLLYTANPGIGRNWDLGPNMRPVEEGRGLPTRNCLGWAPAASLNIEQLQLLESAGVDDDGLHPNVAQFQLNRALVEKVADFVKTAESVIKIGTAVHESERGSMAQVPWQLRNPDEDVPFNRNEHYCEQSVSERSYTLMDRRFAIGSLITAFRTRKDEIAGMRPYCAYDFNNYADVPDGWHAHRNYIYDFGHTEIWNLSTYRMSYTNKSNVRQAWVRRMLKDKNKD